MFEDQGIYWYEQATGDYNLEPVLDTIGNNCGNVWTSFELGTYSGNAAGGDDQTTAAGAWTALVNSLTDSSGTEYGLAATSPTMVSDIVVQFQKCKEHFSGGDAALTSIPECHEVTPMDVEVILVVRATLGSDHYYLAQDPFKILWRSPCYDN
jgi:hypothetical protein